MKKTVYDFRLAAKYAEEWSKPSELSYELKNAALRLSALEDDEVGTIRAMQCAVLYACDFLDRIIEREVEQ